VTGYFYYDFQNGFYPVINVQIIPEHCLPKIQEHCSPKIPEHCLLALSGQSTAPEGMGLAEGRPGNNISVTAL